ncbi:hypothetical protein FQN57_005062 [Myotisia sp. PD_48]|nr:hypothetical protein FQN57_005062 [Myotisia sp. PD_48]
MEETYADPAELADPGPFFLRILPDTADETLILEKASELDSQVLASHVKIDRQWTSFMVKKIAGAPQDRLILFRPQQARNILKCIRVYQPGTNDLLWDLYNAEGIFIGKVPKDCAFDAMLVDLKFITAISKEQN